MIFPVILAMGCKAPMIVWTVYPSAVTSRWDKSAADSAWDFCSAALPCPWSAESVAQLYKCRWRIEVFFKQIKQTLQLADFLETSANAVRWQIWTALLVYMCDTWPFFRTGRTASAGSSPSCAPASDASGTYSGFWPAMGQPEAASAIWGGRNRRSSRDLSESMGQPMNSPSKQVMRG